MPKLIVHENGEKNIVDLERSALVLGRGATADLRIHDRQASRAHCRIENRRGGFVLFDVGSQNGTFLNGSQVLAADLNPGDMISIGTTRIYFEREPDPGETAIIAPPVKPADELVRRLTRERSNLIRLQRVAQALATEPDLDKLLTLVVDSLIELTGAERGFLIRRQTDGEMEFAAARNFDEDAVRDPEVAISRSIAARVMETGEPVLSVNARDDDRWDGVQSIDNLGLRSVLAVPLIAQGEPIGAVYVDHRLAKAQFSGDDLQLVEAFGSHAATAVQRARLVHDLKEANRVQAESQERIRILNEELKRRLAVQEVELVETRARLRERAHTTGNDYSRIVGRSKPMMDLFRLLDRVVSSEFPVLIQGASGTGKELIARAVHDNSPRAKLRYVSENCAALPDSLLESELFGYEKGAFTGARTSKKGLLQVAHRGTLFLDEVGDMSPAVQKKLLRFLQEGEFRPVGSRESVHVDVRIVSASNKDLRELVEASEFREDLFYRLNVLPIRLPLLRERKQDIPLLVNHFLTRFCSESGREIMKMRPEVVDALVAYHWPGNVRELENEIRMLITFSDNPITLDRVSERIRNAAPDAEDEPFGSGLIGRVEALERREIRRALQDASGNKSKAAEALGISRFTLQRKLDKYRMGVDGRVRPTEEEPAEESP
jgi:transcriptional regulator with GAF, ATPase, and Fis domain